MSPSLNLQAQIRALLAADTTVTALVPATNIYDRHARPEVFPSVTFGEHFESDAEMTIERQMTRVLSTIHIWTRSGGLAGANAIASAVRKALVGKIAGAVDFRFHDTRILRDPDGVTGHAIMSFESLYWGAP